MGKLKFNKFLWVDTRGYFYVKVSNLERKLTPKEERSRDKWREKGRLAEIQTENGWSREELTEHFHQVTEAKLTVVQPTIKSTEIFNSAYYVLNYLTPPRRKKK